MHSHIICNYIIFNRIAHGSCSGIAFPGHHFKSLLVSQRPNDWFWPKAVAALKKGALSAIVTLDDTFHRQSCVITLGNRSNVGRLLMYSDARK